MKWANVVGLSACLSFASAVNAAPTVIFDFVAKVTGAGFGGLNTGDEFTGSYGFDLETPVGPFSIENGTLYLMDEPTDFLNVQVGSGYSFPVFGVTVRDNRPYITPDEYTMGSSNGSSALPEFGFLLGWFDPAGLATEQLMDTPPSLTNVSVNRGYFNIQDPTNSQLEASIAFSLVSLTARSLQPVPVPTAFGFMALGVVGLARMMLRREKKAV